MKKILPFVFVLAICLSLCACKKSSSTQIVSNDTLPQSAAETVDAFLLALQGGDLDTAASYIVSTSAMSGTMQTQATDGIIKNIMGSSSMEIKTVKEVGEGQYLITVKVEALDYRALVNALPENISSKEEAREKMLELASNATRATFDGEISLLADSKGDFYIEPDISFINAITGGFYDVYTEIVTGGLAR